MRGHVAKKGDRFYTVVYEGTDRATGKQRHRWYPGGATRKEAERVLDRPGEADARRRLPVAREDHRRRLPRRAVAAAA